MSRDDLTHANERCLTPCVFEHKLRDHRHPVLAITIILQNMGKYYLFGFMVGPFDLLMVYNTNIFNCMPVLGLNHHIFSWSVR